MKLKIPMLAALLATCAPAQMKSVNPTIKKIVDSVSEERVGEIMKKLESFQTRDLDDDAGVTAENQGAG